MLPAGGLDWSGVRAVVIEEIEDTHEQSWGTMGNGVEQSGCSENSNECPSDEQRTNTKPTMRYRREGLSVRRSTRLE